MDKIAVVILAAGKGTRMGQESPKVLTKTSLGISLLEHVLSTASKLNPEKLVVVTGHGSEEVKGCVLNSSYLNKQGVNLNSITFALQKEQLGTGDAVKSALPQLKNFKGTVVTLYGDVPLLKADSILALLDLHQQNKSTLSLIVLSGSTDNAYGRIVKNKNGQIEKIVEFKDCSPSEKLISETNSAIYAVDSAFLEPALASLKPNNAQQENYFTDIVAKAYSEGQTITPLYIYDSVEVQGVNTPHDLQIINQSLRNTKVKELQSRGVIFLDPNTAYIESSVIIEAGVSIGANVTILGNSIIKKNTVLEGTNYIVNSSIDENVAIRFAVRIEDSEIGKNTSVGPFAHLRPKAKLLDHVHLGNFVEIKNSTLASGTKAGHLAYIGDAELGHNVNVGAGTIFANYDGVNKNKSIVNDNVFIGSNSVLIAPIEVGENATIGAGSVVAKKVEGNCLTVTRAEKTVKKDWKRPQKK